MFVVFNGVALAHLASRRPGPRPPRLLGEHADSERARQAARTAHSLTAFAETLYYQMLELQEIANTDACEQEQPYDAGTGHRCVKYALLPWTVLQVVLSTATEGSNAHVRLARPGSARWYAQTQDGWAHDVFDRFCQPGANPREGIGEFVVSEDGVAQYKFARPVTIREKCLRCHGEPAGEVLEAFPKLAYVREGHRLGQVVAVLIATVTLDPDAEPLELGPGYDVRALMNPYQRDIPVYEPHR